MDGVLWKGDAPIGDLPAIFAGIARRGLKVVFATNNGSRTPQQYVERLGGFGVRAELAQIVTSALGVTRLLEERFPSHASVDGSGVRPGSSPLAKRGS
jgi:4-nitrophenyl phosphatase